MLEPTKAMHGSFNASGKRMKVIGYFDAEFKFGSKSTNKPLVIFEELKGFVL